MLKKRLNMVLTLITGLIFVMASTLVFTSCDNGGGNGGSGDLCVDGHTPDTPTACGEVTCTVCSKIITAATHTSSTATTCGEITCTVCSYVITAGTHTPGTATACGEVTCTVCDYVITAAEHTFTISYECDICDHSYTIGDTGPGGGIIFYVADGEDGRTLGFNVQAGTGFTAYTAYYLEAAPSNSSESAEWGARGTEINGVTTFTSSSHTNAKLIGNGRKDTQLIVAHLSGTTEKNRAAQLASSINFGGKNDWFLPSSGELYQLSLQINHPGFIDLFDTGLNLCWSSSQYDELYAWSISLHGFYNPISKSTTYQVLAVRAF